MKYRIKKECGSYIKGLTRDWIVDHAGQYVKILSIENDALPSIRAIASDRSIGFAWETELENFKTENTGINNEHTNTKRT